MQLADQTHHLLEQQKREWDALRAGYESLSQVKVREFNFDGFTVKVQFNPGRIISTSARVDDEAIRKRPCFLCRENRPKQQYELPVHDGLVILCNPFPIFPEHFTIPTIGHTPQRIASNFGTMLDLARRLAPRYTVFYNGPKCGASAPDHLHFQAGTSGFMPVDSEYASLNKRELVRCKDLGIFACESYLRRFISLEGADIPRLASVFDSITRALASGADEPMMNIVASFDAGSWRIVIFPRRKHRPGFYDAPGAARILLSPAAVDLGGVCITPLERDFERMTENLLVQMFEEVTIDASEFARLTEQIKSKIQNPQSKI